MRPTSTPLPSLDALKDQAKRLRARFAADGEAVSHSRALELKDGWLDGAAGVLVASGRRRVMTDLRKAA